MTNEMRSIACQRGNVPLTAGMFEHAARLLAAAQPQCPACKFAYPPPSTRLGLLGPPLPRNSPFTTSPQGACVFKGRHDSKGRRPSDSRSSTEEGRHREELWLTVCASIEFLMASIFLFFFFELEAALASGSVRKAAQSDDRGA